MGVGWTIVTCVIVLCLTLTGLYAISVYREVRHKEIILALKVAENESKRISKLN